MCLMVANDMKALHKVLVSNGSKCLEVVLSAK